MGDGNGRGSLRERVSDERDRKRGDESKRSRVRRSPGSESSDEEGRPVNRKRERSRRDDDRWNGRRESPPRRKSQNSDREERRVDVESDRRRKHEEERSRHRASPVDDDSEREGRQADRKRGDEAKRSRVQRSPESGGSESSDEEGRPVNGKREMSRRDDYRRSGRRESPAGRMPESSDGEERRVDVESDRKRKNEEERERDRDRERGDERKKGGHGKTPDDSDSESSDGERRQGNNKRESSRRDDRRSGHRDSPRARNSESSDGEERQVDVENDRKKKHEEERSRHRGSPKDDKRSGRGKIPDDSDPESPDGERRRANGKRESSRRDDRRSGHRDSPRARNSESSDGDERRVDGERDRKRRVEGDRSRRGGSPLGDDSDRKRTRERIDERKRGGRQRSPDDVSESSDEDRRRRDRDRRRRERERRRHREDDDSDSSGGRRKRDRRGDERRDRGRKQRNDLGDDGDARSRRDRKDREIPESKGDLRDGKVEEAAKAQIQRDPASLNANPGGDIATLGRTGGVYIPPFKLARMMKEIEDKSSVEYQRLTWDALRKSINGLVNKVNATNIKNIIPELFSENLIRGRGLFCRSCMKSQMASPGFTDVFAALVAVVNTKFPEIGDLLLRRIILQLKRAYKRNDKPQLIAAVKFIAHLVNQQVAHELVALELLTVLLEQPTDDSVEVAVDFVKECGSILQDLCPKGLHGIFERFRGILHEGEIDKRVQFLIEGLFAIRKAKFQGHPAVRPELDLVDPEDQLTHEVSLDDEIDPETSLDIFKQDPNFVENERRYEELKKSILGEESEDEDGSDAGSDDEDDDDDEEDDDEEEERMEIKDATETNLINLRRTIYLTIMSSVDFEEAGHKLLKIKLEPGQEMELCIMLLECCSQERTYLRYYGLLGQRFCMINKVYQENFEKCFVQQYSMIHRLETNKLRNVAKFFAHLLGTDALPWHVLAYIRLTEEDTTSSSRIFIKILFQELSEHLGIRLLNERLNDPAMQESFESIFPRDNPRNTRFSINFFTSIGLGGITENLREYLKNMPRMIMQQQKSESENESGSSGSGSGSSDSGSSSSSESESESSSSDSESSGDRRKKRRKRN